MTRRQILAQLLQQRAWSLRELAEVVGESMRTVNDDLEHLRHRYGRKLKIEPATCNQCNFVFRDRRRFTTPSRCPRCRSEWIGESLISLSTEKE